jgi:phage shock protein A
MSTATSPLTLLKREMDSIRSVVFKVEEDIAELNNKVIELSTQKTSLLLIANAIDNDMERLRNLPSSNSDTQIEFDLDPE